MRHFLTVFAAVLYGAGYAARKIADVPYWIAAAVRVGWEDG